MNKPTSKMIESNVLEAEVTNNKEELTADLKEKSRIEVTVNSGARGKSAYEIWLDEGNTGTRADFIEDIRGMDGDELYTHPETHSASMITETEDRVFLTSKEKELVLSSFIHDQIASSSRWVVEHDLDKYPSVTIVDTAGTVIVGQINYISKSEIELFFTSAFSGKAYLN